MVLAFASSRFLPFSTSVQALRFAAFAFFLSLFWALPGHAQTRVRPRAGLPTPPAAQHRPAPKPAAVAVASAPAVPEATPVSATPPAPRLVQLAGTVLGPDGLPRPGASVFVVGDAKQMAVTDAQGNFELTVPAVPNVQLQADFVGLGTTTVKLDAREPAPVFITLGESSKRKR